MKLRSFLPRPIIWITGLSLLWAILIAFNLMPVLRGSHGWRWPYAPELTLQRIAPIILGIAIYIPVALWLRQKRSALALLLWTMIGSVGLPLAAVHVRGDVLYRLYTITVSGVATGWHMAATRITDLAETLHVWPIFITEAIGFSSHVAISPPGMVLIYYTAGSFLARFPAIAEVLAAPLRLLQCHNIPLMWNSDAQLAPAWLGILMPVWGSLTILALYRFGRRVFGMPAARWAIIWWPLVPSFLVFAPLPHTVYPLLALIMVDLLLAGLSRNRPVWVVVAGLLMSALTFLTFAFTLLILLAGLLTLGFCWHNTRTRNVLLSWRWPIQMGIWFGLGFTTPWFLFFVATGVGPWDIWRAASPVHLALVRPYWPWIVLHLNDFLMFAGWPMALLAGIAVWASAKRLARRTPLGQQDVVILAVALTVLGVDLSGTMRGESGRILLYLVPFLLLIAVNALNSDQTLGKTLTVMQGLIAIVMVVCLHVLGAEFTPPPASPPDQVAGAPAGLSFLPGGATFGGAVRLNAFAGQIEGEHQATGQDQRMLHLWLEWEPLKQMEKPYYLALIPVAPDGQAAAAATLLQPFQQLYPTTCWKPGDRGMRDRVDMPLFKEAKGDWWVSLALIDGQTGQALSVRNPDGSFDRQAGLGPFER